MVNRAHRQDQGRYDALLAEHDIRRVDVYRNPGGQKRATNRGNHAHRPHNHGDVPPLHIINQAGAPNPIRNKFEHVSGRISLVEVHTGCAGASLYPVRRV